MALKGKNFGQLRIWELLLDYRDWRNFQKVLARATQACEASNQAASDHFVETTKMVVLGSGAQRELEDVHLSRYACTLVVQNGDPAKPVIAAGQAYFAIQTRRQELADDEAFRQLREDEKRLFLRNELKEHNKQLVEAAQQAGVATATDFAIFQNHGYRAVGGLDQSHPPTEGAERVRILIIWVQQNWRLISFELPKRRKTQAGWREFKTAS